MEGQSANFLHPQIVTLIIDNSNSMREMGKCDQVTQAVQDLVITAQYKNVGSMGFRFLLNLVSFGDSPQGLAVAASPPEIDVDKLLFKGDAGGTDMPLALQWAEEALRKALDRCRKEVPNYQEELAPNPLCIVLSDGENTGSDPSAAATALRSIPFKGGCVDVYVVGVGMKDEHFEPMKAIAARPEHAIRIDPEGIATFLADVKASMETGKDLARLTDKR